MALHLNPRCSCRSSHPLKANHRLMTNQERDTRVFINRRIFSIEHSYVNGKALEQCEIDTFTTALGNLSDHDFTYCYFSACKLFEDKNGVIKGDRNIEFAAALGLLNNSRAGVLKSIETYKAEQHLFSNTLLCYR